MRIDDKLIANYNKVDSLKKEDNGKVKSENKESPSVVAKYEVSSITDKIKKLPDVRQDKVDQLRNQIESGTYSVSGRKVAEKIVGAAIDNLF
ncbi:MAG: flagellar biosynthesis anti-sigma factor FlgM [Calditerrivibrio sp.]|nr:flagellar biosynthesis anti-sigma factor FlgM [Calditerrivibrio sp.]MCA1980074.1 flagellar biosynthesis anti-sigma factor FlgM [Calditerrivibrio sp.]